MPIPPPERELLEALSPLRARPASGPDDVPAGTLDALVAALSSPDPQVRDDLAATTLTRWIVIDHQLSQQAMRDLHRQATAADGPLATIGDAESDTGFGRSFAILMLTPLHAADNSTTYLDGRK